MALLTSFRLSLICYHAIVMVGFQKDKRSGWRLKERVNASSLIEARQLLDGLANRWLPKLAQPHGC